ncbi:polysaccharide pyruvyl transferase family protein [Terrabacter sp. BE26]|uniref:polysaccharide pyruvyl transferase family protein n=1 Tax=Terrabacter sp. BE26 TaxID=2898152 RepID=UPI0035BE78BD
MRVLVDQSGYDLLNMGDVAMLQACVAQLRRLWPHADIAVICHDAERLAEYCPGATPVPAGLGRPGAMPGTLQRVRLGAGQVHKMTRPYIATGRAWSRPARRPRSLTAAVRWADVVVASGGGYLSDTWWWHGFGVLSMLDLAQRLGKPTAMFGQGLGPLTHPVLRRQARRVLPRLHVLGLREGVTGPPLAEALGVPADRVEVTGDDVMGLVGDDMTGVAGEPTSTPALGVNARVSGYAGVDKAVAGVVGEALAKVVAEKGAAVIALPVSRYERDADLWNILALWPGPLPAGSVVQDLRTPSALGAAAAGCRSVVTGSYHGAVYALAAGVPTICLTNSEYFNAKFAGIEALFPAAAQVVPLTGGDLEQRLAEAVDRSWDVDQETRQATRQLARRQARASVALYERFAELVDAAGGGQASRAPEDETT